MFDAFQFGNPANQEKHYQTTGPEIWEQTDGKVKLVKSRIENFNLKYHVRVVSGTPISG